MLANNLSPSSVPTSEPFPCAENGTATNKRKRRPAGTPDPDAEVVSLSPKTLLESDRYVCEICNQGFQRDQNLQMHRRRHKVPWKLLKRETPVVRKRVFVCPEPTCLHHDPCHALGDLVGIKKHFRRKHSNHKQWVCERCSKGYAVQSDYKAHLKTCGTRGHSCDCGRVFSRVESFIEHQDACNMGRLRPETQPLQPAACLSRTASSPSPSSETNFSTAPWPTRMIIPKPTTDQHPTIFMNNPTPLTTAETSSKNNKLHPNLELQLSTTNNNNNPNTTNTSNSNPIEAAISTSLSPKRDHHENHSTHLQLSIGSSDMSEKNESNRNSSEKSSNSNGEKQSMALLRVQEQAREHLRIAMAEKAYAEEARKQAKRQIELAEQEFTNAKRIRQQAQSELDKAYALKEHAMKQINSTMLQITCHACKQHFQARNATPDENSLVLSYVSSAITTEGGEVENDNGKDHGKNNN
ncbi:zinc finger protein SHOOT GRAVITROPISM 5-like [Abrus precatorius]|uniref:Zinc finger protein SHOOT GRAVITROPISM 5-like n=1 Tax=Abrus precatorius TaxID=3816 RepID=A0A8B8LTE8_ABRPR|nr:zinc finger protein SHOOT GRAVITROPISM 5-like [Abrus precatorius]